MRLRFIIFLFSFIFLQPLWAITCYITLAKDNCWTKYDVTVDVMDATTAKVLTSVLVPKGKNWTRSTFPCETNGQKLMYRAQFSPVIWANEENKIFYAKNYWSLPDKVNPGDSAWNVSVCYAADFSEVPFSPDATGNCACDFSQIPPIAPKQL